MQRRKVEPSSMNVGRLDTTGEVGHSSGDSFKDKPRHSRFFRNVRNKNFMYAGVSLVLFFTVTSFMFPSEVQEVEREALYMEQQMEDYLKHKVGTGPHQSPAQPQQQQQPPPPQKEDMISSNGDVSEQSWQSLLSSYSWVEGEKKLKKCLKPLAERQAKGQDLGVPVLTRWLGDDMPCYVTKDVNQDEWEAKVKERYAQMRDENKKWQEQVKEHIDAHPLKLKQF